MRRSRPGRAVRLYRRRGRIEIGCVQSAARGQRTEADDLLALTANELRLLEQATRGMTDKQIAHANGRSYRTIQTQMQTLRRKLRMRTRFELGYRAATLLRRLAEQLLMTGDLSQLEQMLAAIVTEGPANHRERAAAARATRGER